MIPESAGEAGFLSDPPPDHPNTVTERPTHRSIQWFSQVRDPKRPL
jgi:hypothetical protein